MDILEKEIEDVVYEALISDREGLEERGLPIQSGVVLRQPNLGSYGIADIIVMELHKSKSVNRQEGKSIGFATSRTIGCTIIELKKEVINVGTLIQAVRYCRGIERAFAVSQLQKDIPFYFQIVLIGKKVDTSGDFVFMADAINNLSLYTYEIDLYKGITFRKHKGYYLSNEDTMRVSESLIRKLINTQDSYINIHGEEIHQPELEGAAQA